MSAPIYSDNPAVKAVIEGTAPRAARVAAARGVLPLPAADLLEVLVAFAASDDEELAADARETLVNRDPSEIAIIAAGAETAPTVLAHIAGQGSLPQAVHSAVLSNPRTPPAAIVGFARTCANGELLEQISLNQQLLIQTPGLIDAILANPSRTTVADRYAAETKREFFEKERGAQQIINELRAQGKIAAAEFLESAETTADGTGLSLDDAVFIARHIESSDSETDDSWLALEYVEEIYEETVEERQEIFNKILGEMAADGEEINSERISMLNRIMKMGIKDRVRLAMKGDREARNILIRDPNRLVSQAVANNPRITEQEVEAISAMRTLTEDILRSIAANRRWSRNYGILHNLVKNPRVPIGNALTLMTRLQMRDLKALAGNKNVTDAVRRHAKRMLDARSGKR